MAISSMPQQPAVPLARSRNKQQSSWNAFLYYGTTSWFFSPASYSLIPSKA
jgi:hypothetical protein